MIVAVDCTAAVDLEAKAVSINKIKQNKFLEAV